jgi:hypothetical protein
MVAIIVVDIAYSSAIAIFAQSIVSVGAILSTTIDLIDEIDFVIERFVSRSAFDYQTLHLVLQVCHIRYVQETEIS